MNVIGQCHQSIFLSSSGPGQVPAQVQRELELEAFDQSEASIAWPEPDPGSGRPWLW